MKNEAKEITMVNINEIKENPKNPNRHDKEGIERLKKNIRKLGFRSPLVVSRRSGLLIVGHGRLTAAKSLAFDKLPVVYQDFKDDAEEYQHMLADNALADWAHLDFEQINKDIGDLGPFDIELLGIKDFEIEPLDKYADKDADAVPEQRKTDIVLGDLFQLGEHRLMCGDSTSPENIDKLLGGKKADMVFTDPPYGMGLDASYSNMANNSSKYKTKRIPFKNVIGDDTQFDPTVIFSAFDYVKEIFLWGADYYCWSLPKNGSWVVWDKREDQAKGVNIDGVFGSMFELCWSKQKHARDIMRVIMSSGYLNKNSKLDRRVHPTQKPVRLAELFFEKWGKNKTNIVDLYGGSGSILIACEKTNRKCFMMEIDPSYCQVIIDRWEKFTGKKAVKLN